MERGVSRPALWWRERGSGQPVLLVPGGLGLASDYLDPVVAMLEGNARVIQFDPRGCGRSASRPPYDVETGLADIEALRNEVGVEAWVLVGHSAGATLAFAYGLEYAQRCRGVVAIAGGSGVHDDRQWHTAYEAGLAAGLDPAPDTRFAFNADVNRAMNDSWRRYIKEPHLLRRISEYPAPLLAIHGAEDIRPRWPIEQLAELVPRGAFYVLAGAGHIPWTSHAEDIRGLILEYLRSFDVSPLSER